VRKTDGARGGKKTGAKRGRRGRARGRERELGHATFAKRNLNTYAGLESAGPYCRKNRARDSCASTTLFFFLSFFLSFLLFLFFFFFFFPFNRRLLIDFVHRFRSRTPALVLSASLVSSRISNHSAMLPALGKTCTWEGGGRGDVNDN